jgi:hypothetical protein
VQGRAPEVQARASGGQDDARAVLPPRGQPRPDQLFNFFMPLFWMAQDPPAVAESARRIVDSGVGGHYFGDNLLTWGRNMSMLDDPAFVKAWRDNIESPADEAILWRRYVLACAAYHCVQLGGDFVECGAYTGVGMKTVIDYLGGPAFPRGFWGYDVFEHDPSMLNHSMPEHGPRLYERVRAKFAAYPQVRIVRGLIPQSFDGASPERIAYLHIDLNQAPAEIAALDALFDRVVPGGLVILDDYEWSGIYRAQKLAEDPWFEARNYRVMPLPTGQGLVIKR